MPDRMNVFDVSFIIPIVNAAGLLAGATWSARSRHGPGELILVPGASGRTRREGMRPAGSCREQVRDPGTGRASPTLEAGCPPGHAVRMRRASHPGHARPRIPCRSGRTTATAAFNR